MEETGRNIVNACESLLVIGDGDTGFGGSANVMRTVEGYARAGFAGISIEDQMFPKRCAFAKGVLVEPRGDAVKRMKAAIAARDRVRAHPAASPEPLPGTDAARPATSQRARADEGGWAGHIGGRKDGLQARSQRR
mmetsp:Transcript_690/g.2316  ORF Transcript_690/g.2316 Transcript_690/m.2316 type:complete len:136 (+) Transcript_690:636-1043(+)